MSSIILHTDGGCSGNPGPGAWAYVMRFDERVREDSGYEAHTTNNRMELRAVIEALEFLAERLANLRAERSDARYSPGWLREGIQVFTDSQYVKNGVNSWLASWKAKGWKTADKKPVKNVDLWMRLDELVLELHPSFSWVEGHAGVPDNERCDEMVRALISRKSEG